MKLSTESAVVLVFVLAAVAPLAHGQQRIVANSTVTGRTNIQPNLVIPSQGYCDVVLDFTKNQATYSILLNNVQGLAVVHLHQGNALVTDIKSPALVVLYNIPQNTRAGSNIQVTGTFTSASFNPNALLAGKDLSALGNLLTSGLIYCDVHGPPPASTSLIRGQMYVTVPAPKGKAGSSVAG